MGVLGEQLGEIGPADTIAGPCRELVCQRLVMRETATPRLFGGLLVAPQRLDVTAAPPGQLGFENQQLGIDELGAPAAPATQPPQIAPDGPVG